MAIIKAEEMQKLSEEELKDVDGGVILIKDTIVFDEDGYPNYSIYYIVRDDNGKTLGITSTMGSAVAICKEFGCSTEVIDERKH